MFHVISDQDHQDSLDKYNNKAITLSHILPWRYYIYDVGMDENTGIPVERDFQVAYAVIHPGLSIE